MFPPGRCQSKKKSAPSPHLVKPRRRKLRDSLPSPASGSHRISRIQYPTFSGFKVYVPNPSLRIQPEEPDHPIGRREGVLRELLGRRVESRHLAAREVTQPDVALLVCDG